MDKNEKKKAKSSLKKTILTLSLGGALLASPVLLSGCETDAEVKNGVNGKTWHAGTYNPREVEDFGENGDFYLDEDDFLVYKKEGGEWLLLGKIQGEDAVSVDDTTYVYYVDADLNVYVDITTYYSNNTRKTTRVYPGSKINVGKVMTLEKALEVAPVGATIALTQDVVLDESIVVSKRVTIDFAGHSITNSQSLTEGGIFTVAEGGDVTFVDSLVQGSVNAARNQISLGGGIFVRYGNCYAVSVRGQATCSIEGGTFVGEKSAINVEDGALEIEGGSFQVNDVESRKNTLTCATGASIAVSGGEFIGFNPAKAGDEGKNFMAEGSTVISMVDPVSGVEHFGSIKKDEAIDMLEELPSNQNATITLSEDMVLTKPIQLNKHLTIDLNGYIISNSVDFKGFEDDDINAIFNIQEEGLLTINDSSTDKSGAIVAKENDCFVANLIGGDMVVNGGTINGNVSAVQVENGTLTINGGVFLLQQTAEGSVQDNFERYTINCVDDNYKNGADVIINGGKFRRYNPANCTLENPQADYVAKGKAVVKTGEYYVVEDLQTIIDNAEAGATIELYNDVVIDEQLNIEKSITINGNNHTISNEVEIWDDSESVKAWSLVSVRGAEVNVIINNLSLVAAENDCYAIDIRGGAQVTLNGNDSRYIGNISAVYAFMGKVIINGGEFDILQKNSATKPYNFVINCFDSSYASGEASFAVNGGRFKGLNPADSVSENPRANFVADGHGVVEEDGYFVVKTQAEIIEQMALGTAMKASITLGTDWAILEEEGTVNIVNGMDITINLNGHNITAKNDKNGDGIFHVTTGGKLTINGEGVIDSASNNIENKYHMAVWADGGEVVITGGTYTNTSLVGDEDHYDLIYVKNGGKVTINGGTFECKTPDWVLNSHDTITGTITVTGGKFKGFNPADSVSENPKANFVAEGHGVVEEDGYYVVKTQAEIIEQIALGSAMKASLTLGADWAILEEEGTVNIVNGMDITINLNGHNITAKNDKNGDGIFHVTTGGKLTINGEGVIDSASNNIENKYHMAVWADGGEVFINGGTYTNTSLVGNEDHYDLIYVKNGGKITINGGTFECKTPAWVLNSHDTITGTITVTGGKFKGFNPMTPNTEPDKTVSFVADGYTVESSEEADGTWYTVVQSDKE